MSKTHKAIATTAKGVLEEIDAPTLTPGQDEVLVKNEFGSMIAFDGYQTDMAYFIQEYPHTLGFSGSGTVVEVGPGVENLGVDDKVTTMGFPDSKRKTLQEYSLLTKFSVSKVPSGMALDAAATIPDNFVTAFWTLFGKPNLALPLPSSFPATSPPPDADSPILVYGAGATSGQYTVQLLKLAGYTKVFAVASERNFDLLKKLGASHVFDYHWPDMATKILEATNGASIKTVIDTIAATPTLAAIQKLIGPGSKFAVLLPVKAGETVSGSEMMLPLPQSMKDQFPGVHIYGIETFKYQQDEEMKQKLMPQIIPELLASGVIQPNRVLLLKEGALRERIEKGLDLLRNNKVSGEKVVVQIAP